MRFGYLIFVVFVSACNPAPKKSITKKIDNPRYFQDGGIVMLLPGTYVRSSFQEIDRRMNDLQSREGSEGRAFVFRDSTDARNTFYFTESSYLDVEEDEEEKMFSEFESVMMENSKEIGAKCRPVENNFFTLSNGDRVYKMSYLINDEYSTTYFMATKTRIVMVIVHNVSDDGEATVRTMNIDRYFYVDPMPD